MTGNRIIGFIILAIIGIGVSECSSADRNSEGTITKQGEIDAFETRIGDCFASIPEGASQEESVEFETLDAIPCTEPHKWQVVHKGYINDLSEFSDSLVSTKAKQICDAAFREIFVSMSGVLYEEYSKAQTLNFLPTAESWEEGDRTVDCLIGSDTDYFYSSILK